MHPMAVNGSNRGRRMNKQDRYDEVFRHLDALCAGETDPIALMATIACELYAAFDAFDWVGFYRNMGEGLLKVGPYQGGHGCLLISFDRGICGKCAREEVLQNVPDVNAVADHIACSSTTRSEIVVPIHGANGGLLSVLDIDSDSTAAFDEVDESNLQNLSAYFGACC